MTIIFSPEFSGTVYVKSSDKRQVMMDSVVMNTIGLVNMLELRLGLHYEELPANERMAHYYAAVCRFISKNPGNVMAASFATAGLSTARAMLAWRDELRGAHWCFEGKDFSERLAALVGVEEYFREKCGLDLPARMDIVMGQLATQQLDCSDMTIRMPIEERFLQPAVAQLMSVLRDRGARLELLEEAPQTADNLGKVRDMILTKKKEKIKLDPNDESILVYQFQDEKSACEYFAYKDMKEVDVWVNGDNKQMDNWLRLMNKAMTGSTASNCLPHLTQLFVTGLGLFAQPLNVNTLIEWLNMPVHPIDGFFRSILAETIEGEGGYRNKKCREKIEKYINGDFVYLDAAQKELSAEDQEALRLKDKEKREDLVRVFLPSREKPSEIKTADVREFVEKLASWARQKAHFLLEKEENELWVEQLAAIAQMCDTFSILLDTIPLETMEYGTIDSWMSAIYEKGEFTNAIAEKGCRVVVGSPAKLASVADTTVWMGVDGDTQNHQECDFLYPSERKKLLEGGNHPCMIPWDEGAQNHYRERAMLTPLRMTGKRLILVVRERVAGEVPLKHPLIVRLEQQVENFADIVRTPRIAKEEMKELEPMPTLVEESDENGILQFKHADKIKWEDHLSPTTIDTLVEHPFDYLMERLLGITADGKAEMSDVRTTKGSVAHAVIETLFAPRGNDACSTPAQIADRIEKEYESAYLNVLEAKGAILQLAENKLEEQLLHEQLRDCLGKLLNIISENELVVTGCEKYVEAQMGLGLPKACDKNGKDKERDMLGFIDMTLEHKVTGPVVFDFKWSSWSGYGDKIAENRSVQLELYRMMLSSENKKIKKKEVASVAYFLLPSGRLYSKESFKGPNCVQVTPQNNDDIVKQLKQSAIYRKEQIDSGKVETNAEFEALQYVKDTKVKNLFPLEEADGMKKGNHFSNYELFKR